VGGGNRTHKEIAMDLGLHVSSFTWSGGPARIRDDLRTVAQEADALGFAKLSVMDHVWQIGHIGPPEQEMLEAYTTLGFLAGVTERIELLAWVTAVVYRQPGLLAKAVTTLDVLSGGRAWLGIGAAWFEDEARGLGLDFPPLSERYERLEEALQICQQMWRNEDRPFDGRHYHLARTLCRPQPLRQPHPPILIGGAGERKTLRLVARYAQACNLFAGPDLPHKIEVLHRHCADIGRDPGEILVTVMGPMDPGPEGEKVDELVSSLSEMASLGVRHYHGSVPQVADLTRLKILGERVLPAVAAL
jgi:F420-dependent oxidoreductase-like protein